MIKRYLFIFLLISLAGFLVLPKIVLADDFENITLTEIDKYLGLPENRVEELLRSLVNLFNSEWMNLISSGYSTEEETAVPNIMRAVTRVQAMNHLLKDVPIEITWGIIKGAIDITRIYFDPSVGLEKLEKLSVEKAVEEGKRQLFQNEIRVTPGAIKFKYISQKEEKKVAFFQYIIIYQPSDYKKGEILIRFYSPNPIEPPENRGSIGGSIGNYTELTHDLPPFIVDIRGTVENYQWVGNPTMKIDFPPTVPDLGIKPLSLWEKYLLKPIETTIKEVEIIITKITGKTLGLSEIWNEIKSFISKLNPFSPAGMVYTSPSATEQGVAEDAAGNETIQKEADDIESQMVRPEEKMTLEEIQEMIDDIAERIDAANQEIAKLMENENKLNNEKIDEPEENIEEQDKPATTTQKAISLCVRTGLETRNKVIFNEIAWMGSERSASDEWIELKNVSGAPIDLTGWQVLDKDNQIKIIFSDRGPSSVNANGVYLLERTSDDSVPGVAADLIYTGALNNTNEALYLFNENCALMDEVIASPDWPAGDNAAKRTMERRADFSWQTSANVGGTPGAGNSIGYFSTAVSNSGGSSGGSVSSPAVSQSYPKILIAEIQIAPTEERFIELYNPNNSEIGLSGWYVQRKTETGASWNSLVSSTQFEGKSISPNSHFLISRSATASQDILAGDLTLTESNAIALKNPNRETVDKVGWGNAQDFETVAVASPETGKSIGRKWSGQSYIDTDNNQNDFELQSPTPKTQNQSPNQSENQLPVAQFVFASSTFFIGQEITFDASSSTDSDGSIAYFIWDFGDNNTSTTTTSATSHSYSVADNFLINLQVIDDKGTSSLPATSTITVVVKEEEEEVPTLSVVINEIAWMGTSAANSSDEWIELLNNTASLIDLTGWKILKNGQDFIELTTSTISGSGFYLLERTASDTTDVVEDQIYTGSLSNGGEKLELRNASNTLIDLVDFSAGWPAGSSTPNYISMERINSNATGTDSANWANNNLITRNGIGAGGDKINGTPKAENSVSKTETQITNVLPFDEFSEITLTYLGNPYIINNLEIPENSTLKIEPGVTLKFRELQYFGGGDSLIVKGTLIAEGTIEKEIIFTSFLTPEGSANWWSRVYFAPSSQNSRLNYSQIRYGGKKQTDAYAIIIDSTSVDIKNSVLENFNESGIKMINSSSAIENLTIQNTNSGEAALIIGGSPTIKNSNFKNTYSGVFIKEGSAALFDTNNFEGIDYLLGPILVESSYPTFKNNTASNNVL
ncbi:MAG: lamin tail domain-containing protein, partial [bacterium]|nr:lamin tail domain-containing protein [bacterium]